MATTTLDNLIMESGRTSGIGQAAEPLTRELLKFMTGGPGGLSAFLERFRSAGMSSEVASFMGGREEATLPSSAVNTVMGENTVAGMARKVGVAPAAATSALGFEIPRLIGMLTPGGKVPTTLPNEIQSFVGRPEQVRPVGMNTVREETEHVRPMAATAVPERGRNLTWLWGLLALAVLAGILWTLLSRPRAPQVAANPPVAATPAPPAAATPAPAVTTPAPAATAPAPAAAPPAAVTNTVTALNQELSSAVLNFPTGSAQLPAAASANLQQAAERIKTLPAGTVIEIGGHTDNTGNAAANMDLSQRRADAVREGLIQHGVSPAMLTARGYGQTKPIASNDTPDGRLQNRRTEFTVAGANSTTTTTTTQQQ